ncbi:MAG: FixH family protein [Candidatus Sulfobium sp.]|jgi:hypothetical protein
MNMYLLRRTITLVFLFLIGPFLFGFQNSRTESEQGNYIVSAEFLTSPIKTGRNTMRLIFYDRKSNEPVNKKLELEVIPWMPTNVHAITGVPVIKYKGEGVYSIENIRFDAAGDWEVYIKIKNGNREDSAVVDVSVVGQ